MVHGHDVLRADDLRTDHLLGRVSPVIHPRIADGQRPAADMEHERHTALGEAGPERVVQRMTGRPAAGRTCRDPHEAQPEIKRRIELGGRHRSVAGPVGAGADRRFGDVEQRRTQRRVDHLMVEAVDAAEGRLPLRAAFDELVA